MHFPDMPDSASSSTPKSGAVDPALAQQTILPPLFKPIAAPDAPVNSLASLAIRSSLASDSVVSFALSLSLKVSSPDGVGHNLEWQAEESLLNLKASVRSTTTS